MGDCVREAAASRGHDGHGCRSRDDRRGAVRGGRPRRVAVPSRSFREALGACPRRRAGVEPRQGSRSRDRRAALDARADRPVAVLSGPNMAEEVAAGLPGATVIAVEDEALALRLQEAITSTLFRVYMNTDLIGVELCAAAKNVIALAAGGVDGLGARRQREGGDHHARARRDGAARRGVRRPAGDVLGPRRAGRPGRHVLAPVGPQPPRRRADRARRDAGRGEGARSARWSRG